jgi:hypothetical protein
MQYGTAEQKESGRHILSTYLTRIFPDSLHIRIAAMNRTQLARRITKYYAIEFPPAAAKTLPSYQHIRDYAPIHVESCVLL